MKKIIFTIFVLSTMSQVALSNKLIIDNNLTKVNGMDVKEEKSIIKPSISPYILEVGDDMVELSGNNSNTLCPIEYNKASEHCMKVEEAYNNANRTNIRADVEYGSGMFMLLDYKNEILKDAPGFVNYSSAMWTEIKPQLISLDIRQRNNLESVREGATDTLYSELTGNTSNAILNFRGMGNDDRFITLEVLSFNAMGKELQTRFRGENIFITSKSERGLPFSHSFYLRGTTLGTEKDYYGTSFSSPTVMGYATNVAAYFPNMSLHQIKQTLLTTATPVNNSGYLDNKFGWGYVNEMKAINGPAQFNAGLLDEEARFAGMPDKIYDNQGRTYFYMDVPENDTYVFSNDITSGLRGDSYEGAKTKQAYEMLTGNDLYGSKTLKTTLYLSSDTTLKLTDDYFAKTTIYPTMVIPSEYRMYADRASAGLRKAGKGTLRLVGKQLYSAHTQVLEGTLQLENQTNSTYEILEGATMIIVGNNIHIRELKVAGNVRIYGNNITIDRVEKTPKGVLELGRANKNITINELVANTMNPKAIELGIYKLGQYIQKDVEFEDVNINPKKTFDPHIVKLTKSSKLDKQTKLKDLQGIDKFNLLQYNDKTDSFDPLPLKIDEILYPIYKNLKRKGEYGANNRDVDYYDVIFNNGPMIWIYKE